MTIAEKFLFLVDRMKDEKEFYMGCNSFIYQKGELLQVLGDTQKGFALFRVNVSVEELRVLGLELKPQWVFTEDEKVILRNLPNEFQWLARDEIFNGLFVYSSTPTKFEDSWSGDMGCTLNLKAFRHIFQSIQWSNDEPCEFRKYL